jgi:hypothetical protein
MGSAAAGPGGRTNPTLGAYFGDLRFEPEGYDAMRDHGGGYREHWVYGVNRKIPKRDVETRDG